MAVAVAVILVWRELLMVMPPLEVGLMLVIPALILVELTVITLEDEGVRVPLVHIAVEVLGEQV